MVKREMLKMIREELLNEQIKQIIMNSSLFNNELKESNCVSFEVVNYVKHIVKDLVKQLENKQGFITRFSIGNNNFWEINKKTTFAYTKPNKDFNTPICVILSIYDFDNVDSALKCSKILNFGGEYEIEKNTVSFNWYSINNNINTNIIEWYLQHEFLHIFQKNKTKFSEYNRLYNVSLNVLNNTTHYSEDDIKIASLFYWLNKKEINANAQMLYPQLKNNIQYYETETYKEYALIKNYLNDFKTQKININNCIEKEFKFLNINKTIDFFQNYLNYANGKFGHVITQINNEKDLNENNFKPIYERLLLK